MVINDGSWFGEGKSGPEVLEDEREKLGPRPLALSFSA